MQRNEEKALNGYYYSQPELHEKAYQDQLHETSKSNESIALI